MIERPVFVAALLLVSACSVEQPREATADTPAPVPAAVEKAPPPAIPPAEVPSPPEPSNAAGAPIEPQDQARLREVIQAMAQAADEASAAEGQTTCERAYESTVRFASSLREAMGGSDRPEPNRARFLASCNRLPENVQQCMVMGYSVSHQAECARVRTEMGEADRERVRQLSAALGTSMAPANAPGGAHDDEAPEAPTMTP